MEQNLLGLLAEFKSLKESNQQSVQSQKHFSNRLKSLEDTIADVERKLSALNSQLEKFSSTIPKSVEVIKHDSFTFRVEPRSWLYLGLMIVLVSLSIWFTPAAKQGLREWQMEQDFNAMKAHLDYHIERNKKTESNWKNK